MIMQSKMEPAVMKIDPMGCIESFAKMDKILGTSREGSIDKNFPIISFVVP